MDKDKTIKNWRWWVILPIALPLLALAMIPKLIIFLLEMIIAGVEVVNLGDKPSPVTKKILTWVHKKPKQTIKLMSNREQSNKILFIIVIGGLAICCAWPLVEWLFYA